jgi:hypothetical protein
LDRARKKLIEELIRVGRLIDPAPGTGQRESEDNLELSGISQHSDMDPPSLAVGLEGLPVVDDVVDRAYTTKDMFTDSVDSHVSRFANTSGPGDAPLSERIGPAGTDPEHPLSQEATTIGLPVEELARELVTLIEDRVSQRSGEQLDDAFRDELTQAVTAQLEGWLKYD